MDSVNNLREVEEAKEILRKAIPYFDLYLEKGQIEIINHAVMDILNGETFYSDR